PCPLPSPSAPPPSPKKETMSPPPLGENIAPACQHDCCKLRGHSLPSMPLAQSPPLWPWHPPPEPQSNMRNYWNDDLDRFSRMQRTESLEMGYRMNFRQPPSVGHHQRHGPPPMLIGHHREPPAFYFPPPSHYGRYQHGCENPNGCATM
ncbi:hypothetical protein HAX54_039887, partial [Datura stramonium]|nr:hypothetical protein [Datura stramonium]